MALINTITVQRKAVAFTELATVLMAVEHRPGMEKFTAETVRDMQGAFSDLAYAMGFDLVPLDPPARHRTAFNGLMSRVSQPIGEEVR